MAISPSLCNISLCLILYIVVYTSLSLFFNLQTSQLLGLILYILIYLAMWHAEVLVPNQELRHPSVGAGTANPWTAREIPEWTSLSPTPALSLFSSLCPLVCSLWVSFFFIYLLALCFSSAYFITYSIYLSLSDMSPSIISSRSIHVVTNGKISFFLWLGNILLAICTTSSLSIYLLMDTHVDYI